MGVNIKDKFVNFKLSKVLIDIDIMNFDNNCEFLWNGVWCISRDNVLGNVHIVCKSRDGLLSR